MQQPVRGDAPLTTAPLAGLLGLILLLLPVSTSGRDLEEIIACGAELGLAMVVGSNGMMLTERRVRSLKHSGLLGVGISVDSLDADKHDAFRGRSGAWEKTMAGIDQCRRQQLSFQIHFSVTEDNAEFHYLNSADADLPFRIENGSFFIHTTHQDTGQRTTHQINVDGDANLCGHRSRR